MRYVSHATRSRDAGSPTGPPAQAQRHLRPTSVSYFRAPGGGGHPLPAPLGHARLGTCGILRPATGDQVRSHVVRCAAWQCPRSAFAPAQGAPDGSGWLGAPRGRGRATGRPATASGAGVSRLFSQPPTPPPVERAGPLGGQCAGGGEAGCPQAQGRLERRPGSLPQVRRVGGAPRLPAAVGLKGVVAESDGRRKGAWRAGPRSLFAPCEKVGRAIPRDALLPGALELRCSTFLSSGGLSYNLT